MTMHSSYSIHRQNRPLVGCLTVLVGGPLLCCCLGGLFYGLLPMFEQGNSGNLPIILLVGALLFILMLASLGLGMFFLWSRRNHPTDTN